MIKVAVVRGQHLNKWELQNYEPMADRVAIEAFATVGSLHQVRDLQIAVRRKYSLDPLVSTSLVGAMILDPILKGLGLDNYLFGLQRALAGFDIVHVADSQLAFSWQAAKAKRRHNFKLVSTCWETIPFVRDHFPFVAERRRFFQSQVDLFLAMSPRAHDALVAEGISMARIRTIFPGVNLDHFRPLPGGAAASINVWSNPAAVRILFVGRMDFSKGIRDLLLAASEIRHSPPQGVQIEFALVGNGNERIVRSIEGMIRSLHLEGIVSRTAGLPYASMPALYASADMFVLPSVPSPTWEEQFGMVLAESMACGKAVVATCCGAIPDVVGDAGILVPPYDCRHLASAIIELAQDAPKRQILGESGVLRARRLFDSRLVSEQLLNCYHDLLGR